MRDKMHATPRQKIFCLENVINNSTLIRVIVWLEIGIGHYLNPWRSSSITNIRIANFKSVCFPWFHYIINRFPKYWPFACGIIAQWMILLVKDSNVRLWYFLWCRPDHFCSLKCVHIAIPNSIHWFTVQYHSPPPALQVQPTRRV